MSYIETRRKSIEIKGGIRYGVGGKRGRAVFGDLTSMKCGVTDGITKIISAQSPAKRQITRYYRIGLTNK